MISINTLSNLCRLVPCPKTITYYSASLTGFAAGVTIQQAESRPCTVDEELLLGGGGRSINRTFHVWRSQIGTLNPTNGDKIVDDTGTAWIVGIQKSELSDQRYRLICKQLR